MFNSTHDKETKKSFNGQSHSEEHKYLLKKQDDDDQGFLRGE